MTTSDHATEPGRLDDFDDELGHQTAQRRARPAYADRPGLGVFTERYWYMGTQVPQGDVVFGAGLGWYPNRGVMDGYIGLTVDGVQHAFQGSRHLDATPFDMRIGPMRIELLQNMARHRLVLEPNASGLSLDLEYRAAFDPNDEGFDTLVKDGHLISQVSRFVQMGHYVGWAQVAGRRLEFTEANPLWGARDRSWGLRLEARTDESTPPVTRFRPLLFMWVCAQFDDRAVHVFLKETAPGKIRFFVGDETYRLDQRAAPRRIVRVEHDLEFIPDEHGQFLRKGSFQLHYEDGTVKRLGLRTLPGRFFLKAGMYGGWRGWFQGDDKGPLHTAHVRWDLSDPTLRRDLRTLAEQAACFELDGQTGWGTVQGGIAAGYERYTEVQHLPFM